MDDLQVEGAALKKMVKLGKKQALSFAFCPGPQNNHVFMIHRRRSPEMLGKLARKEGESPKVAFGTFEVKGRTLEMSCGRTVPQMAKLLKKYLKSQKITANVVILDADGEILDSDIEDLPPDPEDIEDDADLAAEGDAEDDIDTPEAEDVEEPETETAPETPVPDAKALAARLKALQPAIAAAEADAAAKLKKVMAGAVAQIKAAALEQADTTISALEAAVAKLQAKAAPAPEPTAEPAPAAAQPDLRALAQRAKTIQGALTEVAAPARDKLATALGAAVQQIRDKNHESAEALLAKIEAALAKIAPGAADAPATDATSYAKLRTEWITARATMRAEIETLKSAIETAIAGQEGLEDVAGRTDMLFDYIQDINGDLEDTLRQLDDTSDPAQRAALMQEAERIIQSYRDTLDSDFFKAVDKNGFVKTDIRGSTLSSLQQVSAALAA